MNSLFKSSVPGASPGASATTPAICPSAPVSIAGSDVLWGEPEGGGHQRHEPRIVGDAELETAKLRSDARVR
jgi:hypothetical protein